MESFGDALVPGDDYQKAKASCLLVSFVTIALSFSAQKKPGEPTIKVLDVELSQPLEALLVVLILCLIYCAYNFSIHYRRAFLKHSENMYQYKNLEVGEAIKKLSEQVTELNVLSEFAIDAYNSAQGALKQSPNQSAITDPPSLNDELNTVSEKYSTEVRNSNYAIQNGWETGPINYNDICIRVITEFVKKYESDRISDINYQAMLSTETLRNDNISAINKLNLSVSSKFPELIKKVEILKDALTTLSKDIAPSEKRYFEVTRNVVVTLLIIAGLCAFYRILDSNFHVIRAMLQSYTARLEACTLFFAVS